MEDPEFEEVRVSTPNFMGEPGAVNAEANGCDAVSGLSEGFYVLRDACGEHDYEMRRFVPS